MQRLLQSCEAMVDSCTPVQIVHRYYWHPRHMVLCILEANAFRSVLTHYHGRVARVAFG
jgi:hypothetical protein